MWRDTHNDLEIWEKRQISAYSRENVNLLSQTYSRNVLYFLSAFHIFFVNVTTGMGNAIQGKKKKIL
jgi:hypothetical protein